MTNSHSSSQQASYFPRGWAKRLWRDVHLWLGIGLFVLLVPVALSGAILVYHDDIGDYLNTPRGAVAAQDAPDLGAVVGNATKAAGENFQPVVIRFPDDAHAPLAVSLRGPAIKGQRPQSVIAYIDRSDARVLDLVDFRSSFFGFMHIFHENLTIPFYYGRDIVGWTGVAMLVLSLTGLYLWWPRHNQWSRAFAWRRSPATSSNLHHMTGFWICFPLAFISLTGIYLAWPKQGRAVVSSVAQMSARPQRGQILSPTQQTPAQVYAIAAAQPDATVSALFYPTKQTLSWRVRLNVAGNTEPLMMLVDDRSGAASVVEPLPGDRIASWIRWLHEGSHSGQVWRFIVFVTGLMPAILGVTGILLWLRQRRQRALIAATATVTAVDVRDGQKQPTAIGSTTPAE